MAIKAQVPSSPSPSSEPTSSPLPIHSYHIRPRPLAIIIGEPIHTTGLTSRDADALTQRLFQTITETYLQQHHT